MEEGGDIGERTLQFCVVYGTLSMTFRPDVAAYLYPTTVSDFFICIQKVAYCGYRPWTIMGLI